KSCPCAVYRVKWSKLAIIRWPLWSSEMLNFCDKARSCTRRSFRIAASIPLTFCGIAAVVGRPELQASPAR
ncbi:hypothetical protein L9F63_025062, partial [Diploptera punctata]